MFLEPGNQLAQTLEHVLMEEQTSTAHSDGLLNGLLLLVDIDQDKELRVLGRAPKEVMNGAGVPSHIQAHSLLNLFQRG